MRLVILIIIVHFFEFYNVQSQEQVWKEITPLVSTCEDVKRLFKIKECSFPVTRIEMPDYSLTVRFRKQSDQCNVSCQTVVELFVNLRKMIKLSDFETDFGDYQIRPEGDAPEVTVYTNKKRGIILSVNKELARDAYIADILLSPSEDMARKHRCEIRKY